MKKELKRYAVLASGNGTTLQSIIDAIKKKKLDAEIKIVISNTSEAYALERAKEAGIKTYVLKDYKDDQELYQVLKEADIDLVILSLILILHYYLVNMVVRECMV